MKEVMELLQKKQIIYILEGFLKLHSHSDKKSFTLTFPDALFKKMPHMKPSAVDIMKNELFDSLSTKCSVVACFAGLNA